MKKRMPQNRLGERQGRNGIGLPERCGPFPSLPARAALCFFLVPAFLVLYGLTAGAVDITNSDSHLWGTDVPANTALSDVTFTDAAAGDVAAKVAAFRSAISTYKITPNDTNRQAVLDAMTALSPSVIANRGVDIGALRFDDSVTFTATDGVADQRLDVGAGAANFDVAAGKTVTVSDNIFIANEEAGGALYVDTGGLLAKTGGGALVFNGNAAGDSDSWIYAHGGALYNKGIVSLNGPVVFANNTATGNGGAINNEQGIVILSGKADFTGNHSEDSGGAIRNYNGTVILAGETTFKNNTAEGFGAAIDNQGASAILLLSGKTSFIGNTSEGHGVAVYNNRGIVDISGETIFESNSTTGNSTLENSLGTLNISGPVTFTNNTGFAGAMDLTGSSSKTSLTGSAIFTDNNGRGPGGAIYSIWGALNLNPVTDKTILFSGNQADGVANSIFIHQDGTLLVGGAGTVDMRDPMAGEASSRHNTLPIILDKSDTGVWKLGGLNSFTVESAYPNAKTQFTVSSGTLHLYREGEVNNGRNGAVATGSISLTGTGSIFAVAGVGAILSVGGSGHSITAPTITLMANSTLAFELAHHAANPATPMLTLNGTVATGTGIIIDLLSLNKTTGTYTLVYDGVTDYSSGFKVNPTVTYRGVNLTGSGTRADGVVTLSASGAAGGEILVTQTGAVANKILTWTGTTGAWDLATQNWTNGGATTFWDGDAVTFDATAAAKTVNISSHRPTVAAMNVTGGDYTFTGEGIIAEPSVSNLASPDPAHGKLKIAAGASVDFTGITGENSFANGVDLGGKLTIANRGQLGVRLADLDFTETTSTTVSTAIANLDTAIAAYATTPTPGNHAALKANLAVYNTAIGDAQAAKTLGTLVFTDSAAFKATTGTRDQRLGVRNKTGSFDITAGKIVTISGNDSSGNSGALRIYENGLFAKTGDGTIEFAANNASGAGGAINNSSGTVSLDGPAIFKDNTAEDGGAIANSDALTRLDGQIAFIGNTATMDGGAVCNYAGSTIMNGSITFESNVSDTNGGAIYNLDTLVLSGEAKFANNTAMDSGGAIYAREGKVSLTTDTGKIILFSGNTANNIANSIFMNAEYESNNLAINGEGLVDMRDPMAGFAEDSLAAAIAKNGAGSWNLGGNNAFTAAGIGKTDFAVSGGTLHLYRAGEVDNGRNGAVETGSISLAGTGSSFALGTGAKLSIGGSGHTIAAPTITLANNSTLAFDVAHHGNTPTAPMLTLTGTAVTPGTALNVDLLSIKGVGVYTLASAGTTDFSAATNTSLLTYRGASLAGTRLDGAVVLDTSTAGLLKLNQISAVGNKVLTWAGTTDGEWDYTTENWLNASLAPDIFFDGDAALFTAAGLNQNTVSVRTGGVLVAGMEVAGGDYTFGGGDIKSATAVQTTLTGANHTQKLSVSGTGKARFENNLDFANGYAIAVAAGMTFAGASIKGNVANAGDFTFDVDTGKTVTYTDKLSGVGDYFKDGAGTLVLSGANTYSGMFGIDGGGTLKAGAENTLSADGVHILINSTTLDLNGYNQTIAGLAGEPATSVTLGSAVLTVDQDSDETSWSAITGTGGLTKKGSGKLTLSGISTYSGTTTVSAGTLALELSGSIANSSLVLGANGAFDITGYNGAANPTVAGFEATAGATLDAGTKTLDLRGNQNVAFDLAGIAASGGKVLEVNATTGGLLIDAATKIALKNAADTLQPNDHVILADVAAGAVSDAPVTSGRWNFALSLTGGELWATIAGISSYVEATNNFLGPLAPGNANVRNGGAYLDWLTGQPYGNTPGMNVLDNYFTDITATLDPARGGLELQRFHGAYAAYANQALRDDADRFRRRWRKQNHFFLDGFVFSGLLPATVGAVSAPASPAYGARQCVPAGNSHVWASGFGSWSKQDSRSGHAGYKYDSHGLALGYDYTRDRLKLGVAAAYSRGDLKVNDLGYKNEADVFNLALHAAYAHESGFYAEGGLGYGHAWNDYRAAMLLGGRKTGDYGSDGFSADLELGYIARLARGFNLVPSAGVEYDYLRNGSWSESVSAGTAPANRFASGHDHSLDIPFGLRVNKVYRFGWDGYVVPEARVALVYTANRSRPSIQSGFVGAPGGVRMQGVRPGRSHWRLGAALSGQFNNRVDFHLEYEYETRSGFKGHNLNASVGLAF